MGCSWPGQVRVQQTVRSQESSIALYKIANLVQFYMLTMRRTIGEDALLSKTLQEYAVSFFLTRVRWITESPKELLT